MRHPIARTLTSLMLVVVGLVMRVQAQSTSVIRVNIPFEFSFGDHTFPAGDYSLVQPLQHFVVLRDSRKRTIAHVLTRGIDSLTPAAATKLKFDYFGGQHVLTEVWQEHDSSGERLYATKDRRNFVRGVGGRSLFAMASASIQANGLPEKSTLRFATVDGRHVLSHIWIESADIGNEFH